MKTAELDSSSNLGTVGTIYRGFRVTKVKPLPELQCVLRELVHEHTGAHVLHIANDDPENLFCLSFQTLPDSSNGVAHILEHTVLCGSKKYPVKDPFFAMTRRSLNTFMNALTGSDFTCYPAATQVPKDFYNLLEVYLDAVFHPNLLELSFKQEGHRIEFVEPNNPNTPLEYKGVVYNEMKGALSSANTRLSEVISELLFPGLTYSYNSGGDPRDIPKLTYEELKDFHKTYYQPSRCLFFFYGNMPLEQHLDFIDDKTLKHASKMPPVPPIPRQKRYTKPVRSTRYYPVTAEDDTSDKAYIALSWLTCHILEQEELLALNVLDSVLMDTDASPLRMALLKSGLCKQANSSMDNEISEVPYILLMKGCEPGDADKLEAIIRQKLEEIADEGIPAHLIESAIHQLELQRSEITGDSAPFGLSLFWRSALLKQHGGQPEDGLVIHELFAHLRKRVKDDPKVISNLIRKYLLDNPHCVRITMAPDKELSAKEAAEERATLDQIRKTIDAKAVVEQAKVLHEFQHQQEEQDIDVLPKVSLSDVPAEPRDYPLIVEKVDDLTVYHHDTFTNQILYAELVIDLTQFTAEELPYVRLLTTLFSQVGCGGRDYRANLEYIQEHTGGVDAVLSFNIQAPDPHAFAPTLHIRGKALYRKADKLLALMKEMATSLDLTDADRLKEIILKHYTGLESAINSNAMRYATNLSASGLDTVSRISSYWYGLEYYHLVKKIAQHIVKDTTSLMMHLEAIKAKLLHMHAPHLVLTCDATFFTKLKTAYFYGLSKLTSKAFTPWSLKLPLPEIHPQGRVIASPVAFTAQVFPAVGYTDADAAALLLAANLMENTTLHQLVREKGGAYGGGASSNPMHAQFYFYGYRDPNIASTLEAFKKAVDNILTGKFDEDDLEEAKLEVIQDLDSPVAPGSRGSLAYGWLRGSKTLEMRRRNRARVLAATRENVIDAVRRYILPNMSKGAPVVFAGSDLLEKENALLKQRNLPTLKIEKV